MRRVVPVLLLLIACVCWPGGQPGVLAAPRSQPPARPKLGSLAEGAKVQDLVATGGIVGRVTDLTGAAIPNVAVTATNQDTGSSFTARTDNAGNYSISGLPIGTYRLSFAAPGFATMAVGMSIRAGEAAKYNTTLQVGSVGQGVEAGGGKRAARRVDRSPASLPPVGAEQPEAAAANHGAAAASEGQPAQQPDSVAAQNQALEDWHKALPYGLADHHVDPVMRLGQKSPVTFTIHGPQAPAFTPDDGSTPAKLQVSPMMYVTLTEADDQNGFTIADADSPENPRRVAPDGATTWTWNVTPQELGDLKLRIDAYVLPDNTVENRVSYQSYEDTIDVHSVTLWGYLTMGMVWVLNNPGASLKWILPGGAGAALIAKGIQWLMARRKKAAAGDAAPGG